MVSLQSTKNISLTQISQRADEAGDAVRRYLAY
jgi:hypothetical protein